MNEDIPKYRKKKKKTNKKSDHKHLYDKEVIIRRNFKTTIGYYYGTLCTVCGKIGEQRLFETEKVEGTSYYKMLSKDEFLEKYKHLEIVDYDDLTGGK